MGISRKNDKNTNFSQTKNFKEYVACLYMRTCVVCIQKEYTYSQIIGTRVILSKADSYVLFSFSPTDFTCWLS